MAVDRCVCHKVSLARLKALDEQMPRSESPKSQAQPSSTKPSQSLSTASHSASKLAGRIAPRTSRPLGALEKTGAARA